MTGLLRWAWGRAAAWPRAAWCGRFHYPAWRLLNLDGGEAALWCPRCGRRWAQRVPAVAE